MRNAIDFSSWQGVLSTLLGLAVVSLVAVGIRLLVMQSVQQRRERQNRQINERLKTLISAYKSLGGSFTGDLTVDPSHLRELHSRERPDDAWPGGTSSMADEASDRGRPGTERRRRTRDAVEAALSDVILLGTEQQVRLAVQAANDMVAGRPVETAALVISLRAFIREVLDLETIPTDLSIPKQGPVRASGAASRGGRAERSGAGGGEGRGAGGTGGAGGGAAGGADSAGVALHDNPP